ncbi:cob(I)yrinic acid a,c-diamide adenosyltransferase [Candidatus Oleimmundimicrobium sp.]|uniref:cob(I)yrinic acid a,c-diamide adenosyltransferase n=1 Tax=Candidatus Oleimmundimicrobium sp. TaxID=3060597 RepID=UPI002724F620|nr:cob(I)yrinic acid a,c-diamide adenosyltransferase [Candidatus Oleimmundimicrobium sp.]MDO8885495.1 cob(I)yrinic acid a,c-diamide adenosyltransferase [Candidatus Oleimmundimicrobium sp.]
MRLKKGLVQVYTGEGKGKTTAALGLAMRAVGHDLKVYMFQFLKNRESGEINVANILGPNFIIEQGGGQFCRQGKPSGENIKLAQSLFAKVRNTVLEGLYDVVILDEINVAIHFGLINIEQVLTLIKEKPQHVELILTGRYAPSKIIEAAQLVTEMVKIKHPYDQKIKARKGIEE